MIDRDFLKECLDDGMSLPEIGRLVDKKPGTVGYWVTRHGLVANGSDKFKPGPRKGVRSEVLAELVREGLTLGQIARRLEMRINTVRYWIEKHDLPKPHEVRRAGVEERLKTGDTRAVRQCRHHGDSEFVLDNDRHWRCRLCRQEAVIRRRRKVKRILVEEAGGSCCVCGYNRTVAALHFHHVDPAQKRFGLAQKGHTGGIAKAREEARKCVLLCATCHVEVEIGVAAIPEVALRRLDAT